MRVAIIGAGFCGLAVAWHLFHRVPFSPNLKVTLFDAKGIGQGASGIAAGLLHPFAGAHAKLNWMGREGVSATKELLQTASLTLGREVSAKRQGILRLALTSEQQDDFQLSAKKYPSEVQWLEPAACQILAPGCPQVPGLWIKEGITVYSALYLQGLWLACLKLGASFQQRYIKSLAELQEFDRIILTTGGESLKFPELSALPLTIVKGQVVELAWPRNIAPLLYPLNSHVYILMTESHTSCLVGATYEKNHKSEAIDLKILQQEIIPKAFELYPPLKNTSLLKGYSGCRAVAANHRPLMQPLNSSGSQWILTGMGSKGLLYHALFAKELAKLIGS